MPDTRGMTPSSARGARAPGPGLQAVRDQLGGTAPAGLERLAEPELRDLADAIRQARRRQAEALAVAGDRALSQIPRLLRGPVRRIVGAG
jgi:hypothetical protein